jgi:hypothetical protein
MALHRDIFWIGRQWAVTGHGMQLIDQRLMGDFDIAVAQLWDDDLIARMHERAWLNAADFETALSAARSRHQRPARGATSEAPAVPSEPPPAAQAVETVEERPAVMPEHRQEHHAAPPVPVDPVQPNSPGLQMNTAGRARFASPWRVWMKRKT